MPAVRRGVLARAGAGEVVLVDLPWGKPLKRGRRKVVRVITKVVSADRSAVEAWCRSYGVPVGWVHRSRSGWWHVDLWGRGREAVLARAGKVQRACVVAVCAACFTRKGASGEEPGGDCPFGEDYRRGDGDAAKDVAALRSSDCPGAFCGDFDTPGSLHSAFVVNLAVLAAAVFLCVVAFFLWRVGTGVCRTVSVVLGTLSVAAAMLAGRDLRSAGGGVDRWGGLS